MFRGYFKMTCSLDVLALDAFKEGSFSVFFSHFDGEACCCISRYFTLK